MSLDNKLLIASMDDRTVQRQLEVKWKRLSTAPKPGLKAAEKWKEKLADLKRRARKKNPTVHAFKQLKECVRSTKNKLKAAMGEIGKMQEFVSKENWRSLRWVSPVLAQLIKQVARVYAKSKMARI